jgi:choline dehydrogenase-like flavoprotein
MNQLLEENMIAKHCVSELEDAASKDWDVVIIGGGMGGLAAAYALTKHDHNVLVVEKGLAAPKRGSNEGSTSSDPEHRLDSGYWPTQIEISIDGKSSPSWPALGCGLGGSTLLYAASLGRLEREDFVASNPRDSASMNWPFRYEDLEQYYLEVEKIFGVSGTEDPLGDRYKYDLADPPAMHERDRHYYQKFAEAGLHPYRIHNAIKYNKDCSECGGHICISDCKGDASSRFAAVAITTGKLTILEQTEVVSIESERGIVSGAQVSRDGEEALLSGKIIILAAGSLFTPAILQSSKNDYWPDGLGNNSDQVGRNLMFHASDFVAVFPRVKIQKSGPSRTLALRDFYKADGVRYGEFQSMGLTAGYAEILTFLHREFDKSFLRRLPFLREFLRIPAYIGSLVFSEASVFATIVEDKPYAHNRVVLAPNSPSGIKVEYQIEAELKTRVTKMRKMLKDRISALRILVVNSDVTLNYGHACGTCRAGHDPATSVVDANCRVHGIDNLFIVDGSFMPTSGGTNPSLTIAANALRVSDHIDKVLNTDVSKLGRRSW